MDEELRLVAVNGFLGYGYPVASLENGVQAGAHLIGADNGSTDPGPYYLGSGEQLVRPAQLRRDLRPALLAARRLDVPLVIGSAGTAGGEPHLQAVLEVLGEVVRTEGLGLRVAAIHAEIDPGTVLAALDAGRVWPMAGVPDLSSEQVKACERIVGQMGVEPFIEALDAGADVIVAGRSCDTAIYAALPILHGFDPGLAFHLAKIMECGAQCALPLAPNDSLLGTLRRDHFKVRPLNPARRVTVQSVAAHALYEQPDPHSIVEPTGRVDLSQSIYEQVDERTVAVRDSAWIPAEIPTIKLEGARLAGYRSCALAGVRDPAVIANLDTIEGLAMQAIADNLDASVSLETAAVRLLAYGRDAVMGSREPSADHQHELGLLLDVVARSQQDADAILALLRSSLLHCSFPGRKATAGNLAFPMSPADMSLGPVYEFCVYHLIEAPDPGSLFSVEHLQLS